MVVEGGEVVVEVVVEGVEVVGEVVVGERRW